MLRKISRRHEELPLNYRESKRDEKERPFGRSFSASDVSKKYLLVLAYFFGSDRIAAPPQSVLCVERKYTALSHARFATEARRSRAVSIANLDHSFKKRLCAVYSLLN